MGKTVLVGISGGVDSSMSAYLLKSQGYDVITATMQIYDGKTKGLSENLSGCYGPSEAQDIEEAAAISKKIGVPHYVIPLAEDYRREVLDYFTREYKNGRTPNPCVRCNQYLKFGLIREKAKQMGLNFDYFATGHYCRVSFENGRYKLLRALDATKDQSYFLARLKPEQLKGVIFPLGELTKVEVKKLAEELGFKELAEKKESQDFIAADSYDVLFDESDAVTGSIVTAAGKVIGEHRGLIHYTVGQRRGVGLGGSSEPLYVTKLDTEHNCLVVGPKDELYSDAFEASDINWFDDLSAEPLSVEVKIRQKSKAVPAKVVVKGERLLVTFETPQLAVTPGQVAVFYSGDEVLGSGIIELKQG